MIDKQIEKLKELVEQLYCVNASISGNYVSQIEKIDYEGICEINKMLGHLIGEFRKALEEK